VEVLDPDGPVRSPDRYDARGQRRQAGPLTIRRPNPQPPNTTVIVVPEPRLTPPMTQPARPDRDARRRERRRGNGYLAFGAQSGVFLGLGGGLALALAGERDRVGATVGSLAAPILGAALAGLLRRWARNDHWREGPGQAMAGIYPGAIQGALFAGSIMHAFGLDEGQARNRTLGLAIGATTLLSMVLHGNAAEAAPKRAGLYYATLAVAALAILPFAHAYDKPEAILYGTTAAGAVHLVLTGMAPTLRW
jgi:hypothetical protein